MIDIGCDLNARNSTGDTALHVVADKRRLDSLIWLLIEGADVNAKGTIWRGKIKHLQKC